MNRWFVAWVIWSCAGLAGAAPSSTPAPGLGCLIEPDRVADLGSPVIGVLEGLRVDRGDVIRKGQVLAVLRSDVERATAEVARTRAMAEADLHSAEANRDFARQKLKRAEDLVARNFLAQQALDQARTELQVNEQKYQQAREQQRVWGRELSVAQAQVGLRTIRSPFDGVVVERYLAQGERVEEKPVFKVARIDPLRVEVIVPAARFGTIQVGEVASVAPDLPNTPPHEATVTLVDKVVDAASNTFRVRLVLPNANNRLPAGLRCRISFADPASAAPATERRLMGGLRLEATLSPARPKPRP